MTQNRKRGLKRFAAAVLIPWFGWWGLVAFFSWRNHVYFDANYDRTADWDSSQNLILMQMENRASENMANAIMFGIFLPIVLLIVGLVIFWVYRGFRPKADQDVL